MLPPQTPIYCVHFVRDYLPLSLGMIVSYARKRLSPVQFDLTARFVSSMEDLEQQLAAHGPGIFLFSDYMWNVDRHLTASAWLKLKSPTSITVHGGPSFPSYAEVCADFLRRNTHVDFGVVGEGEITAVELLTHLAVSDSPPDQVPGLRFLRNGHLVETASRGRARDLDQFPSPYLTGVFDEVYKHATYAVIETNRGCPYGCTFCDWGSATQQKIRCFSLERVEAEIRWVSERAMPDLFITDSNFGIFPRDVEITRRICEAKRRTGFPERAVLSYAKNTKRDLIEIVEMMEKSGLIGSGVMSVQARDPGTLAAIRRKNIKTSEYERLQQTFNDLQLPLDTHLMIGLPGSTMESFKADLRHYFFEDINVRVFNTVLLVNSPMAEPAYRRAYQLQTDESGTIVSTSTLTREEVRTCESLSRLYRCAHDYGMLRYYLSYLWWDHGIDPIEFLAELLVGVGGPRASSTRFRLLRQFCAYDVENEAALTEFRHTPDDLDSANNAASPLKLIQATHIRFRDELRRHQAWDQFYAEVCAYTNERYGLTESSGMATVASVQAALMPTSGREYPHTIEVPHDYVTYYKARRKPQGKREQLSSYGPGMLTVEDPFSLSEKGSFRKDWSLTDVWQLPSALPGAGRSTLRRFVQDSVPSPSRPVSSR